MHFKSKVDDNLESISFQKQTKKNLESIPSGNE